MNNFSQILKFVGALIVSLLSIASIIKLAKILLPEVSTTVAALIAFGGTILAAIINNYFARVSQIESDNRKEKQKNYNDLLMSIGQYVRNPKTANDDFLTVHLRSWIYGSEDVVRKTAEFVELNRRDNFEKLDFELENLLRLMRKDIGLSKIDDSLKMPPPYVEGNTRTRGTSARGTSESY